MSINRYHVMSGVLISLFLTYLVSVYPTAQENPSRHVYFGMVLILLALSFTSRLHPLAFYLSILPSGILLWTTVATPDVSSAWAAIVLLLTYGPGALLIHRMHDGWHLIPDATVFTAFFGSCVSLIMIALTIKTTHGTDIRQFCASVWDHPVTKPLLLGLVILICLVLHYRETKDTADT